MLLIRADNGEFLKKEWRNFYFGVPPLLKLYLAKRYLLQVLIESEKSQAFILIIEVSERMKATSYYI